jgi:hypothetical protein
MSGARTLRQVLNDPLGEPVPDEFLNLLRELPSFSDGGSGAGGLTEVGPTSLGSDIRHADRASREIHAVHDAQSHNLNATLSTRSASDGSDV